MYRVFRMEGEADRRFPVDKKMEPRPTLLVGTSVSRVTLTIFRQSGLY